MNKPTIGQIIDDIQKHIKTFTVSLDTDLPWFSTMEITIPPCTIKNITREFDFEYGSKLYFEYIDLVVENLKNVERINLKNKNKNVDQNS